jgi:multidrug efflux pump subunit AcrB
VNTGFSGRVAHAFLQSKLTPLLILGSLAAGLGGLVTTPREEEPQISVPMIDVFVAAPGSPPAEVERRFLEPLERRLWEIAGVEHLYSTASADGGLIVVRFAVGDDPETSLVKVYAKLAGAPALVKLHTIDDVPVLALTLHGAAYEGYRLRQVAAELRAELQRIEGVAQVELIGGAPRVVLVEPDPARLAAHGLSLAALAQALGGANAVLPAGAILSANRSLPVRAGGLLGSAEDVGAVLVGVRNGRGIRVSEVAAVSDGPAEPAWYVSQVAATTRPAVTLSIAKRPGVNATALARTVQHRVDALRGDLLPGDLEIAITRNYGETANDKAQELLSHILIATLGVAALVWLALGWREALVVLVTVPVTLALTLLVYRLLGYTLNRITLFALVFAIGILVDDAIVVVENITRHLALKRRSATEAAVEGVDEVGNPTILATFTVIAAILPMAFVTGLMGPYMRPIPVGASLAMLFSLAVAFIVTPYLALRLVREASSGEPAPAPEGRLSRAYRRVLQRLLARRRERGLVYAGVGVLLLGSLGLVAARRVTVKMLPFDNKSEFQVVLDFPEGTTLETSARAAHELAERLVRDPVVRDVQVYAGTASPFNFNGLVRHYFLRQGPEVADLQVNLLPKHDRSEASHDVAVRLRPAVTAVAARYGARAKVAEIPPGPPVLATLLAEVYGPDDSTRRAVARRVRAAFEATPGIVDVDWTLPDPSRELQVLAKREPAALAGFAAADLARTLVAVGGLDGGMLHDARAAEPVPIVVRLPAADRAGAASLASLPVLAGAGPVVPVGAVAEIRDAPRAEARQRKDLKPVIYVTADVAGALEAPVYAMLAVAPALREAGVTTTWQRPASSTTHPSVNWDGEWAITYAVFRDLGIAFAAVLVLIYFMVVAWFQSFKTPLVIMAPIPLTLIGILPAHALAGAFFTATSMIGMIALAGIIVRNSILLVDFAHLARERGRAVPEAVVEAGRVRARPIILTAMAVVIGGAVMVGDPIFQGLGIALMAGAVVATALTLVMIPLLYAEVERV